MSILLSLFKSESLSRLGKSADKLNEEIIKRMIKKPHKAKVAEQNYTHLIPYLSKNLDFRIQEQDYHLPSTPSPKRKESEESSKHYVIVIP